MLEKILKLYTTAMAGDVRSPTPHLVGPPGCGKSTAVEQAAEIVGATLHTINVSRISPLDIEGIQMPVDGNTRLHMLTATFWTQLKEGDILLLDEFLRGFPEVYNGLLDILTSRKVGAFKLPKVFIIAASNSMATYDKALDDRLMHLPVADPRGYTGPARQEFKRLSGDLVKHIGLLPAMVTSDETASLLKAAVLPMYNMLDQLTGAATNVATTTTSSGKVHSIRNLIGQAKLREIQSDELLDLLKINNQRAINESKYQYVVLPDGLNVNDKYIQAAKSLGEKKLSPVQRTNLDINLQLIELESVSKSKGDTGDDPFVF